MAGTEKANPVDSGSSSQRHADARQGRVPLAPGVFDGTGQLRALISDALSPAAVQIFRDRGVEVDFQPKLGADKDKLAELIGNFDGLAIRSATKVTPKILERDHYAVDSLTLDQQGQVGESAHDTGVDELAPDRGQRHERRCGDDRDQAEGLGNGKRNVEQFVEDTWKITPKVTLSLGLRYELTPPFYDSLGNAFSVYIPYMDSTANVADKSRYPVFTRQGVGTNPYAGVSIRWPDITVRQDGKLGDNLVQTDTNDFAPRVGAGDRFTVANRRGVSECCHVRRRGTP
jgi:hypothetical protein